MQNCLFGMDCSRAPYRYLPKEPPYSRFTLYKLTEVRPGLSLTWVRSIYTGKLGASPGRTPASLYSVNRLLDFFL